jgi:predicted dienelactone hydrolase
MAIQTAARRLLSPALVVLALAGCAQPAPVTAPPPTSTPAPDTSSVRLPAPTGQYAVGRTIYYFSDPARPELHTEDPDDIREIMVEVWYPAEPQPGAAPGPYLNPDIAAGYNIPPEVNRSLPHAIIGAPVIGGSQTFPVILFNPGFTAFQTSYTAFAEDLASHGYVVAALSHPYLTPIVILSGGTIAQYGEAGWLQQVWAPEDPHDAELARMWVPDTLMVMDQLSAINENDPYERLNGRLDLSGFGLMGHSFGGTTSAEICRIDERCRGAVSLDGPHTLTQSLEGLPAPYMFIAAEDSDPAADETLRAVYEGVRADAYLLTLAGADHFDFADSRAIAEAALLSGSALGEITGARVIEIVRVYTLAFFNDVMRGDHSTLLDGPSPDFPEVTFESHRP